MFDSHVSYPGPGTFHGAASLLSTNPHNDSDRCHCVPAVIPYRNVISAADVVGVNQLKFFQPLARNMYYCSTRYKSLKPVYENARVSLDQDQFFLALAFCSSCSFSCSFSSSFSSSFSLALALAWL